jgi:polysaccharide pyruvyl transferase CsaB
MQKNPVRNLIVVSGYYGFNNLGDEAILEELLAELRSVEELENVVVLSNNPQRTASRYQVKAVSRWKLPALTKLLPETKLFISGGGGLFQDSTSIKPPMFYGGQMLLARFHGAKVMVYAQGIGPLHWAINRALTRAALSAAHSITVRDLNSSKLLVDWGIKNELTADPVWCLESTALPRGLESQFLKLFQGKSGPLIGLSLRETKAFTPAHLEALLKAMTEALPANAEVLLLPLQPAQDAELLEEFHQQWRGLGGKSHSLSLSDLELASQWLNLFGRLDLLIGMRLHAVIMALKRKVPVVGLAYDPKVQHILEEFNQPALNLENVADPSSVKTWQQILKDAIESRKDLSQRAESNLRATKNLACQNLKAIAKILNKEV